MRDGETLFDPRLDAEPLDATYLHVRDSEDCDEDRAYLDAAWQVLRTHADSNFFDEFRRPGNFQARAWELRIAWTLRDIGLNFVGPKPGPDFAISLGDRTVYMEAIAPHATPSLLGNYEAARSFGTVVPDEEIILRYTGAIEEKMRKLTNYRRTGVVKDQDPFVVALSGANIPQSSIDGAPFPRILQPLFAIGSPYLSFPVGGKGESTTGISRVAERRTVNGGPVSCRIFLQDGHRELSAIVFSAFDIKNRPEVRKRPSGNDFLVIHNPHATNPLPMGVIQRGREWSVCDGRLTLVSDWRPPAPA